MHCLSRCQYGGYPAIAKGGGFRKRIPEKLELGLKGVSFEETLATVKPQLIIPLVLLCSSLSGYSGIITLTATARNGTNEIVELSIGQYEVAELLSYISTSSQLIISKNGGTNFYAAGGDAVASTPLLTIAGPATFRLNSVPMADRTYTSFATFRISPEAFPPDRTIIVMPGTNQTAVTMECSTNLVNWFPATNGVYGPMPEAKFFRIQAGRVQ